MTPSGAPLVRAASSASAMTARWPRCTPSNSPNAMAAPRKRASSPRHPSTIVSATGLSAPSLDHNDRLAFDDRLAVHKADRLQGDPPPLRIDRRNGDARGDVVADPDRSAESKRLADVDGARPRQLRAQQR